ncbi:MAG: NAD(P)-dependent oxidoreductase [Proteobacteria bacterium]|nr:NAD(P)-dependent oxidoreductase [Pseudomonadota bacterium]
MAEHPRVVLAGRHDHQGTPLADVLVAAGYAVRAAASGEGVASLPGDATIVAHFDDAAGLDALVDAVTCARSTTAGARRSSLIVDLSPVTPRAYVAARERCGAAGVALVGGALLARRDGAMRVLADGEALASEDAAAVLRAIGTDVVDVGAVGNAKRAAIVATSIRAVNWAVDLESMRLAQACGLEVPRIVELLARGSGHHALLGIAVGAQEQRTHPHPAALRAVLDTARDANHPALFACLAMGPLVANAAHCTRDDAHEVRPS